MIDGLGGVYIDVDSEEIKHINNYQIGIAEVLKCDYTPVTETGVQLLNGLQATAYCRSVIPQVMISSVPHVSVK